MTLFAILVLGSTAAFASGERIPACPQSKCGKSPDSVYRTLTGVDAQNGLDVSLLEIGGGDPAANGAHLYLTFNEGLEDERSFNLGLNVREVHSIKVNKGIIQISASRDVMNQDGAFELVREVYTVTYKVRNDQAPSSIILR